MDDELNLQKVHNQKIPTHQLSLQKVHNHKISTRVPNSFFRSRCDQDPSVVKPMPIKPMPECDPNEKLLSLSLLENGEGSQRKVAEFTTPTSH